jgi:hypothetical protein
MCIFDISKQQKHIKWTQQFQKTFTQIITK